MNPEMTDRLRGIIAHGVVHGGKVLAGNGLGVACAWRVLLRIGVSRNPCTPARLPQGERGEMMILANHSAGKEGEMWDGVCCAAWSEGAARRSIAGVSGS